MCWQVKGSRQTSSLATRASLVLRISVTPGRLGGHSEGEDPPRGASYCSLLAIWVYMFHVLDIKGKDEWKEQPEITGGGVEALTDAIRDTTKRYPAKADRLILRRGTREHAFRDRVGLRMCFIAPSTGLVFAHPVGKRSCGGFKHLGDAGRRKPGYLRWLLLLS